jgi:hypothetical protein
MRIFKNTWFTRFAGKNEISDEELKVLVNNLEAGSAEVDLGSGVYKQRLARHGKGTSGGYRIIVFYKSGEQTFFVYGFAKSDRENLREDELQAYRKMAKAVFSLTGEQLDELVAKGKYKEL